LTRYQTRTGIPPAPGKLQTVTSQAGASTTTSEPNLIAALDVDYRRDDLAVAAGVWFEGWSAPAAQHEAVATVRDVAPYQPGQFFRRELPCLLAVLARGPAALVIIVDGFVWLDAGHPGLGAHLHEALGGRTIVIGVAKTAYAGAQGAVPVCRGASRSPLYVTAAGASAADAAGWVTAMHGPHRLPTLLKRVDRLARTATPSPAT
jgi:deoxyribonuclease V